MNGWEEGGKFKHARIFLHHAVVFDQPCYTSNMQRLYVIYKLWKHIFQIFPKHLEPRPSKLAPNPTTTMPHLIMQRKRPHCPLKREPLFPMHVPPSSPTLWIGANLQWFVISDSSDSRRSTETQIYDGPFVREFSDEGHKSPI